MDAKSPARAWRTGPWAIGGYAACAITMLLFTLFQPASFPPTDAFVWQRVGDEVRSGISPYYAVAGTGGFYYAPPFAILLAAVSWLPSPILPLLIVAAEVAALRYIAGSWRNVGLLCWFPFVARELVSVQWNLIMAATLLAAVRGRPQGAVLMAFAKLSPILAVSPRDWRKVVVPLALAVVVVPPPLWHLWADWLRLLASSYGQDIAPGMTLAIPFLPRLAVALVLAATGRPWARILAAIIAIPSLYPVSAVALVALWPLLHADAPHRKRVADKVGRVVQGTA